MFKETRISYTDVIQDFSETEIKKAKEEHRKLQSEGGFTNLSFEEFTLYNYALGINYIQTLKYVNEALKGLNECRENHIKLMKLNNASEDKIKFDTLHFDICIAKLLDLGELCI